MPRSTMAAPAGFTRLRSERATRDTEIMADFTGRNYAALAAQHNLSTRQVRRIIERERAASRRSLR